MAQSSPIPSHLLPCPTCSCPHSHSEPHFHQPQPPVSSQSPKTLSPVSMPNPDPTLKTPQSNLHESPTFPRSRLFDALHFPQPQLQLPGSAPAPTPPPAAAPSSPSPATVSTPAPPAPAVASDPPPRTDAADLASSSLNPNSLLESNKYKSRLQEYAQRSSIPLPEYRTVNQGLPHAPQFRSSVEVDGITYTAQNTFSHKKAAEQDVAKLAMECISKKIKNEGSPLIRGDTVFCKSILNEFAVKVNFPAVTYKTVQPEALIPVFVSSLVFNGITYIGDPGKSKKEAEQMAARAAIISLMGDSGFGTAISEIIKSKGKLFDALYKAKHINYVHDSIMSLGGNAQSDNGIPHTPNQVVEPYVPAMCQPITEIQESPVAAVSTPISAVQEAFPTAVSQPIGAVPDAYARVHPPFHEFRVAKQEVSSGTINPLAETMLPNQQCFIAFTPPTQQPVGAVPNLGSKRRRKNKKNGSKKARVGAQ